MSNITWKLQLDLQKYVANTKYHTKQLLLFLFRVKKEWSIVQKYFNISASADIGSRTSHLLILLYKLFL